jgi:hypothetical protein
MRIPGTGPLDGKVTVITGATAGIALITEGSRAHYDDAVRLGRRGAQAAPSALTRPKGASW